MLKLKFHYNKGDQPFTKVLADLKAVSLAASIYGEDPAVMQELVQRLTLRIQKWIAREGLVNLCKRLKESEKHFLLTGKSLWFSLRHLGYGRLSNEGIKTLFTIHRNMKVKPNPDLSSIRHLGTK